MERMCLLASGATLGIFCCDGSVPLVFIILSSSGDFVHIASQTCAEIHLTKCCPSQYLDQVLQTLHFKNTYDVRSSYVCFRFHGRSPRGDRSKAQQLRCPFNERLSCMVPVTSHQEAPCGLASIDEQYCVYLQKIFSLKQFHQPLSPASSTTSESDSMASSASVESNTRYQLPVSSSSSIDLNGSTEVLTLYEDLAEEFSLMRCPDYFPSAHVPLIESLNGIVYANCCQENNERCISQEFQIWFDLSVDSEGEPWRARAEVISLRQDIVRHQIREELDDHTALTSKEEQSVEKAHGGVESLDHSYSLCVLQLDYQPQQEMGPGPSVLRRKAEIAHLLRLRDHTYRLWRVQSLCSSIPRSTPARARGGLPATVIHFERSEYDKSGLYLLSDGRVRGSFPRDNLLFEYLPETRALRVTLPDGRERLFSVDSLLRFRDERELMAPLRGDRGEDGGRETLLSLVTRRMLQLLSFRRRALHSSTDPRPCVGSLQESREIEIGVTVSQYRNRKFLSEVASRLSLSP
jgi:hypothetical protein